MTVEHWSDDIILVHLESEPAFSEDMQALRDHLDRRPVDTVIDLSQVNTLNSSNLAQLLRARQQLIEADCRLRLCAVPPAVASVLSVTGLNQIFTFSEDVMTALAGLKVNISE